MLKLVERVTFVMLLVIAVGCLLSATASFWLAPKSTARLFSSAGLLFALSGFVQLEVSGLFRKIVAEYMDDGRHPHGPPSYITREMIDNPDRPIRTAARNMLFFSYRTGFNLVVVGTILQIIGTWA